MSGKTSFTQKLLRKSHFSNPLIDPSNKQNSDEKQFLYETTVTSLVKDVTKELCTIHNLRGRIQRVKLEGEELAKFGPSKPIEKQGLDQYSEDTIEKGPHYNADPTGRRTGNPAAPEVSQVLLRTLQEAEQVAHKDQVAKKVCLTRKMLEEALDNVRGAVMICYPMGLPEWDLVRVVLDDNEDLSGTPYAADPLDPDQTMLWYCGKQMDPAKPLGDHVGRNEKTKVVIKATKKGQQAPGREPVVDPETQKAMLAWHYKRQEEEKKVQADEDDSFANSSWANPKSLKSHFAGVGGNIRIPK